MKKILTILLSVSIFAVSCTEDVFVYRDYDINAEVIEMETTMEMSTLYCNINDAATPNLQMLGEYLTAKSADVVMLVAPVTVEGTNFKTWLEEYALANELHAVEANNGEVAMAGLSKLAIEHSEVVNQPAVMQNSILHFEVNNIHFVVTELVKGEDPIEFYDEYGEVVTEVYDSAGKASTISYDAETGVLNPVYYKDKTEMTLYDAEGNSLTGYKSFNFKRTTEVEYLISKTLDDADYILERRWMLGIDTNSPSRLDATKFNKYTEEQLLVYEPYFVANDALYYNGLVDCVAVSSAIYTPSSVNGSRPNFLYASTKTWQMFQTIDVDTSAAEFGATHYPIMVTLKSEK